MNSCWQSGAQKRKESNHRMYRDARKSCARA
jgi:hypothetical protein